MKRSADLQELLQTVPHDSLRRPAYHSYALRPAADADYSFSLWLYPDGEAGVWAHRVGGSEDEDFWGLTLELAQFRDADELERKLVTVLHTLASCPTRIVQRRRLLWTTFTCQALVDAKWETISQVTFLGRSKRLPSIHGKRAVYSSGRLSDVADSTPSRDA
jgi:hypothetical protein